MTRVALFLLVVLSILSSGSISVHASDTNGIIEPGNFYAKAVDTNFGTFNFGTTEGDVRHRQRDDRLRVERLLWLDRP